MRKSPFVTDLSVDKLSQMGITSFGYIKTSEIVFSEEVRHICEGNRCRNYENTWACPPAVGTLEECRSRCLSFSSAFVFASAYKLEDSFDFDGMVQSHRQFKVVCDRLYEQLMHPFILLSNEGCIRCKNCTYPAYPCRFPDRLFPSLEGYGILVNELAKTAGIPYSTGANTVSYFGLVCYDKKYGYDMTK